MKKDSAIDYFGCIAVKSLGPLIRMLPKDSSLWVGRKIGEFMYYFDLKHKATTYANIKAVFGQELSPSRISRLTKEFYQTFGESIIETFFIPLVNKKYIQKYITIEGLNYVEEAFKRGKGIILLGVHAGSWELSNIICANLGFPFRVFIRDQKHPRLNKLLNSYRSRMGCKIIDRKSGTRDLIRALKNNEAIGMTADQGGRKGIQIKFFGQEASLPTGAIKLALKYDAAIIPGYYTRIKGPYIKTILEPAFKIKKTGDLEKDVRDNLAELAKIFEKYITRYPKDYLWSYKIWKYSTSRRILVLDDGKVGHLRQSQAIAKTIEELLNARGIHAKGIHAQTEMLGIEFRNKFCKSFLLFSSGLSGRYHCQGCLWCLRNCLKLDIYKTLTSLKPDYVVSTGSSLAAINYILSRENAAKSIVNLRPSILSTKRFDLVVMPRHDEPPKRKNIVVTEGALNIIDRDYLKGEGLSLSSVFNLQPQLSANYLGLLIGGDTKNFSLTVEAVSEVIKQIKMASETLRAQILATTSRRTGAKVEKVVKDALGTFPGCAALIIANEKNIPSAVGGILGLSAILIVSPESISMISEAVTSERYVIVFNSGGLDEKHGRFLDYFSRNNYIYLVEPRDISKTIENIWRSAPQINYLKDNLLVKRAIERLV